MAARVRNDKATVYANVGVHADVEIRLALYGDGDDGAAIHFGTDGPDLCIDFADVDNLERLAMVAADGVRRLRERITAPDRTGDADRLVGAGWPDERDLAGHGLGQVPVHPAVGQQV